MLMRFILLLVLSVLLLIAPSCKHSYRISVRQPAVVPLPQETKLIGVINNVNDENSPEKLISSLLGSQQLNGNVTASERAMDGVLRALDDSRDMRGEIFEVDSSHFDLNGDLDWVILDSIAKERGIDGFIELDEIRTVSPVGGTVVANATGQRRHRLTGTLFINVHVVSTGENHERLSVSRVYNIPVTGSTNIIDLLNDVQRKREYYRALGFQLGYRAGSLIYPNWVWVNRIYFTRGTPAIKRARNMLRQGNWSLAEKTLLQDEEYRKLSKRGRVLFNLALAKEGQGELDMAIMFAERAAMECGNRQANEYLVDLRNRKWQMEQLEAQESTQ